MDPMLAVIGVGLLALIALDLLALRFGADTRRRPDPRGDWW